VLCPWKREHGHHLKLGDLAEAVAAKPRVLVIGTGQMGVMEVPDEVFSALADLGIDAEPMPTAKAVERFATVRKEKSAAAALHLTC
jgi:hypothetical protein